MVMAESDADECVPGMPLASDSCPGSDSDDEQSLEPPDVLGEHANQMHDYHQYYGEHLEKRKKNRRSLSIDGIDSSDEDDVPGMGDGQSAVNVQGRVSDQVAPTVAATRFLDDISPAPERENLGAVCDAAGDGALGTLVQGAACAMRFEDCAHLQNGVAPSVVVDSVKDESPALEQLPDLGYVRVIKAVDDSARAA